MAEIEYVKEIDDLIRIQTAFVSVTDKSGLVDNIDRTAKETTPGVPKILPGVPENGLIGLLFDVNPNALVISTGGTADLLSDAGLKVMPVGEFTGWPEMPTGLVKSMQGPLYVGMLGHVYTESDVAYMKKHGLKSIEMTLVNFYPFKDAVEKNSMAEKPSFVGDVPSAFELIRQTTDVGGPTGAHTSRKGFLGTAVATRPGDYALFASDLRKYNGRISLASRIVAMQHCSKDLAEYHGAINDFMQGVTVEDVRKAYPIIHNRTEEK